jgi:hypothetical protein
VLRAASSAQRVAGAVGQLAERAPAHRQRLGGDRAGLGPRDHVTVDQAQAKLPQVAAQQPRERLDRLGLQRGHQLVAHTPNVTAIARWGRTAATLARTRAILRAEADATASRASHRVAALRAELVASATAAAIGEPLHRAGRSRSPASSSSGPPIPTSALVVADRSPPRSWSRSPRSRSSSTAWERPLPRPQRSPSSTWATSRRRSHVEHLVESAKLAVRAAGHTSRQIEDRVRRRQGA